MAAKLLSLYLLVVAGLEVARAGTSTSYYIICPVRWRANRIRCTAPLIPHQRSVDQCSASQQNVSTGLQQMSEALSQLAAQMGYASNIHPTYFFPRLMERI